MPLYEIFHIFPLSESQRDALATAITEIHTTIFTTPSLFVNVHFHDAANRLAYVGGKRKSTNSIHATVRHGPSRPRSSYDQLCARIADAWAKIVHLDDSAQADHKLSSIFVLGSIVAGWENGFELPAAGEDGQWLREHWGEFRRLAEEEGGADEGEWKKLVEEVWAREDLRVFVEEKEVVEGRGKGR